VNGDLIEIFPMNAGAAALDLGLLDVDAAIEPSEIVPTEIQLISAFPNPFNSTVTFGLEGLRTSQSSLRIFDLAGRQVAELPLEPGQRRAVWNAKNGLGQEVAAGMYFANLTGAKGSSPARILYIK
jgi:hypothetical protein